MNSFAGIIRYNNSETSKEDDHNYLNKLYKKFPSRFARLNKIEETQLIATGGFESSSHNTGANKQLFFDGEIYNRGEILKYLNLTNEQILNNASLVHTLIMDKGIESVNKLNGQYLIIYFDRERKVFYLLNDHSGIQQVFYHQGNGFFLFASDIKFLLPHPRCPNEIDWVSSLKRTQPSYVLSGYRSYTTWFKEINLLPEASIAEINLGTGKLVLKKYWTGLDNYGLPDPNDKRNVADVCEEYMALLEDAVKIRVQDSDNASSFLSGGLDSSAICALAAKHKPLDTFSIITQTTVLEDTTTICNSLAKELGFTNTQFLVPFHEINFDTRLWKQRIWRAESPVNHTDSLTKTLLHYAIKKKDPSVNYVLTGTGSDQYNGGLVRWVVNDDEISDQSAENFFNEISAIENRSLISREDEPLWLLHKLVNRNYLADISGKGVERNSWMFYVNSTLHIQTYSLLWDEVRASSSHGHSTRFPFLDYRFAEFIAKIPAHLHKGLFYDKQILRIPSKKILPDYVINKPKAPSFIPEYFSQFRLYEMLTSENDYALIKEAFGDLDNPHPVINKKVLLSRMRALKEKPDIKEWNGIMHIINLGLLEKLVEKDESDLDYEATIAQPLEIDFQDPAKTKIYLEQRLAIRTNEELLSNPLCFAADSALLYDDLSSKFYLSKKNALAYEIEDEYTEWKKFLKAIDNRKSTGQILIDLNIRFATVEEFLRLALKEQILIVKRQQLN